MPSLSALLGRSASQQPPGTIQTVEAQVLTADGTPDEHDKAMEHLLTAEMEKVKIRRNAQRPTRELRKLENVLDRLERAITQSTAQQQPAQPRTIVQPALGLQGLIPQALLQQQAQIPQAQIAQALLLSQALGQQGLGQQAMLPQILGQQALGRQALMQQLLGQQSLGRQVRMLQKPEQLSIPLEPVDTQAGEQELKLQGILERLDRILADRAEGAHEMAFAQPASSAYLEKLEKRQRRRLLAKEAAQALSRTLGLNPRRDVYI